MPFFVFYIRIKSIVSLLRSHNCILLNLTIYIYIYTASRLSAFFVICFFSLFFINYITYFFKYITLIFLVHQLSNLVFYKFAHRLIPFLSFSLLIPLFLFHFFFFLLPHRSFFPFLHSVSLLHFFIPFYFSVFQVLSSFRFSSAYAMSEL